MARCLRRLPSHGTREVLIVMASLTTCDPGDIQTTIEGLKSERVRCSMIGLAAEVYVCRRLCHETGGRPQSYFFDEFTGLTFPLQDRTESC